MKQLSIVGVSRSGKTCYMYAMAKTMLQGVEGLSIIATNDEQRRTLRAGWRKITNGSWPPGSERATPYEFDCSLHLRSIMEFCWDDFKGGILTSDADGDMLLFSEFEQYLQNSDGLILFVSSEAISDILNETTSGNAGADIETLAELFMSNRDYLKNIPITIVLTKSDILTEAEKKVRIDLIKDRFRILFDIGSNLKVLIVPVSLGVGLGRGVQGGPVNGRLYADPKAGNVHIPIVFNLYHFLKDCIAVEKYNLGVKDNEISRRMSSIRKAESHNGIQRWWHGEDLSDMRANLAHSNEERSKKLQEIRQLENDLEKVKNMFSDDCEFYVNGHKVNRDMI